MAEHSFDNGTALSTTGSSQKRHLQGWRSKSTLYNSAIDYVVLQFYVLAVFNYATQDLLSDESWLHDNGTASEYNFCDWDNTDCNGRTDITALSPLGSQLSGSLTPEIGLLTSLTTLGLESKTFTATLPTEVGLLTSLNYLDLSDNTFTGKFPTDIGLLTSLTDLFLDINTFTVSHPTEIGLLASLTGALGLDINTFTGTLPHFDKSQLSIFV